MTEAQDRHRNPLIDAVLAVMRSDIVSLVASYLLSHLSSRFKRADGIYEVLEYQAELELHDATGRKARFSKRQRVRFLQNNVIAYQDQAWGDGDFLLDYRCSPGVVADQYREGHKYRILISLRGIKNRGDIEYFQIVRTIKGGFEREMEDFQIEIEHLTRRLEMVIIFPQKRPPKRVLVIEQNAKRTALLETAHIQSLPDGRWEVRWRADNLKLFEAYILRWEW